MTIILYGCLIAGVAYYGMKNMKTVGLIAGLAIVAQFIAHLT